MPPGCHSVENFPRRGAQSPVDAPRLSGSLVDEDVRVHVGEAAFPASYLVV